MADNKINIDTDAILKYFKNLKTDMWIAYGAILCGIILVTLSFFL